MSVLQPVILGVVQGLTEFLPVSSSGHLVLIRQFLGWTDEGLGYDAVLHLGTLVAVLVYFRGTWTAMLRGREPKLLGFLALGTLPGAVAGFFGKSFIAGTLRDPRGIGVAFLLTAGLLLLADHVAAKRRGRARQLSTQGSFRIGLSQVFALIPGISRSGTTIAAGMLFGLSRTQAVEFSFLLAMPITAAAGISGLSDLTISAPQQLVSAGFGVLAAFAAGWFAIRLLLRTVRTHSFFPYAAYLVLVGLGVLGR